jgi:hypothetical protein
MISELPIDQDEHGGYCSQIRDKLSDTGECEKLCKEISTNNLPDDMNRGPAKYKARFLSATLKYCGVIKGLIGIEIGYLRLFRLFTH